MKIAVLPGDGIGPEIVAQALKVLDALGRDGLKLETEQAAVGGAAYDAAGDPLPAATLRLARDANAILFGAVGGWKYDQLPPAQRPEPALLGVRKELGLFANRPPAKGFPRRAAGARARPGTTPRRGHTAAGPRPTHRSRSTCVRDGRSGS